MPGASPKGAPERSPKAGAGGPSGVDGNGPKRFSVQRKMAIVARLLRGEPLELVVRETNVSIARLSEWRDRALTGAATALKERERDDRDDEIARLKAKVGTALIAPLGPAILDRDAATLSSSSRSRCWNALVQGAQADGVDEPKRPIVGSLDACSARAANGHATATPPSSVMNSRRLTWSIGGLPPARTARPAYRILKLPRNQRDRLRTASPPASRGRR